MTNDPSARPTLARRQLGAELRKLREAAGMTHAEAGAAVELHRNTIAAIEKGKQGTKTYIVKNLCSPEVYNAPPEVMSYLTGLVVKGKQRGLYEKHEPGMKPGIRWFASAEVEYGYIMTWEHLNMPGLLQVPEYYDAQRQTRPPQEAADEPATKRFRFKRQELVFGRDPLPRMEFVIGAGALHVMDDLPEVKQAQIARLLEVAKLPGVDIRVLGGFHPAMSGAFTILSPDTDPHDELSFVYVDAIDACRYLEDPDVVSRFVGTFRTIYHMATPIKEFLK